MVLPVRQSKPPMRKFLYVLGAVTLAVMIAAGVGLGALVDRSTAELRASIKPDELHALFDRLSQFGPLVEYQGATGQATMSYLSGSGETVSASYYAKARFQNRSATFQIVLMKRDGRG
jgi:hypothetical protein